MITIKTVERIRNGSLMTMYNGIYAVLFGLVYLLLVNLIAKMNFRTIDVVWQVFSKYNPAISSLFIKLMIVKGILIIPIGIAIIYLSTYILKKKDKTAWVVLFIIGLVFWPTLLTFEILDKNIYTIIASFVGWITFIIGMVIPIRYYTQREYSEY